MHDSSFWYQYSIIGPRGARGAQHPLAPLISAYDIMYQGYCMLSSPLGTFVVYTN